MNALKKALAEEAPVFAPLCLDPLSARLAESCGFRFGYLSGGALPRETPRYARRDSARG